jgi:hypothetical protein
LTVVLPFLMVGCDHEATGYVRVDWSYEHFRETCGSAYTDLPSPLSDPQPFSADCMTVVGDAIGVDWPSFGTIPHDVDQPFTSLEKAIWGVIAVSGTVGFDIATLGRSDGPKGWSTYVAESAAEAALSPEDDAGALMYYLAARSFERTTYAPWLDAWASIDTVDGRLRVGLMGMEEIADPLAAYRYAGDLEAPSLIVHELAHFPSRGHVACPSDPLDRIPKCDETEEGAYGVEAWWNQLVLESAIGVVDGGPCAIIHTNCLARCTSILDVSGFPTCEGRPDDRCSQLTYECYGVED